MVIITEGITVEDKNILENIRFLVSKYNKDNITRTVAYAQFYERNPEIKWAFLASMVSRNAGWNMCDLEGKWFPKALPNELRFRLFLTYERANWLIFSDAFPQLCIYEFSKNMKKDLSYLLSFFHVSPYMQEAWNNFSNFKDQQDLLTSLIINEQNLIQKPVINHPIYRKKVFKTWLFVLQDWFHFSCVLFPTCNGQLYGCSVHDFRSVTCRIQLGKQLAYILFHPMLYQEFIHFSNSVQHTGSRFDYEKFLKKKKSTPELQHVFPEISHHRHDFRGWTATKRELKKWKKSDNPPKQIVLTNWYETKQKQLHAGILVESLFRYLIH